MSKRHVVKQIRCTKCNRRWDLRNDESFNEIAVCEETYCKLKSKEMTDLLDNSWNCLGGKIKGSNVIRLPDVRKEPEEPDALDLLSIDIDNPIVHLVDKHGRDKIEKRKT